MAASCHIQRKCSRSWLPTPGAGCEHIVRSRFNICSESNLTRSTRRFAGWHPHDWPANTYVNKLPLTWADEELTLCPLFKQRTSRFSRLRSLMATVLVAVTTTTSVRGAAEANIASARLMQGVIVSFMIVKCESCEIWFYWVHLSIVRN
jgi:hypothetical protein